MRRNIQPFYACLLLYLGIVLLNLDKLPVAWVDETMNLDPAVQFLKTGHFASRIWPQQGTEHIFLAYMPLTSFVQIINLSVFPATIFFTRLPGVLFLLITCFFLFRIYRSHYHLSAFLAAALLFLFIHDEGITNAMRSGRAEIILLALLAPALFFLLRNRYRLIVSLLLALLWLTHPAVWILVLILFIYQLIYASSAGERLLHFLLMIAPVGFYLAMADFNLQAIYEQLILHGEEHNAEVISGSRPVLHFFTRFMPVYKVQPWIPVLYFLTFIYCTGKIIVQRNFRKTIIPIVFVATAIYWMLTLAPHYRYTPTLVLLTFILLPEMTRDIIAMSRHTIRWHRLKKGAWVALYLLLIVQALPFWFRNAVALLQRPERNAKTVYGWLDKELSGPGRKLIIDASVGHFYSLQHPDVDFSLTYSVHKFHFSDYDEVYYLTQRKEPEHAVLQSALQLPRSLLAEKVRPYYFIATYDGLRLYRVPNEQAMMELRR